MTIMNHWTNFKTLMGREIAHKTNAGWEMGTVKGVEKNGEFAVELFIHLIVPRNNKFLVISENNIVFLKIIYSIPHFSQ